jgi:hypothetical protein
VGMVAPRGVWQTAEMDCFDTGSLGGIVDLDGGGREWSHHMRYVRPVGCIVWTWALSVTKWTWMEAEGDGTTS